MSGDNRRFEDSTDPVPGFAGTNAFDVLPTCTIDPGGGKGLNVDFLGVPSGVAPDARPIVSSLSSCGCTNGVGSSSSSSSFSIDPPCDTDRR